MIIKVFFSKLQPILCCAHPPEKTNFFEVAKITAYDILSRAENHIIILAVNRLACSQPLCAILRNSLHYRPCYGKTRVWGRYNVYFLLSSQRVNRETQKKIYFNLFYHIPPYNGKLEWMEYFWKFLCSSVNPLTALCIYICYFQNFPFSQLGVGLESKLSWDEWAFYKNMKHTILK